MQSFLSRFEPHVYALMRMMVGVLFFFHGLQKIFGVLGGSQASYATLSGLAGFLELIGGPLVAIGWSTAPTAFILSGEMAVAYYMAHSPRGLWPIQNGGEMAALFAFVFLYIATRGGGLWSADGGGRRRR